MELAWFFYAKKKDEAQKPHSYSSCSSQMSIFCVFLSALLRHGWCTTVRRHRGGDGVCILWLLPTIRVVVFTPPHGNGKLWCQGNCPGLANLEHRTLAVKVHATGQSCQNPRIPKLACLSSDIFQAWGNTLFYLNTYDPLGSMFGQSFTSRLSSSFIL